MTDKKISETILKQLGGNKFRMMTGAKDFVAGENYLIFKLPHGKQKKKINMVKITLMPNDTYKMEFQKINYRTYEITTISSFNSVYSDDLQKIFTDETGLHTKLYDY